MFKYFEIPDSIKERQKCQFFTDYVKAQYISEEKSGADPSPEWVTERYKEFAMRIKNFHVRSDDVWVVSFPKTGTTLASEMVSVLQSGLNYGEIEKKDIFDRVTFLELVTSPQMILRRTS